MVTDLKDKEILFMTIAVRERENSALDVERNRTDDNHITMSFNFRNLKIAHSLFFYPAIDESSGVFLCEQMVKLLNESTLVLQESLRRGFVNTDFRSDFHLLLKKALPLDSLPIDKDIEDIFNCKKWVTNRSSDQKLLQLFRQKNRLRTTVDTNAAKMSISNLIRKLTINDPNKRKSILELFEKADAPSLSRAFDIINEGYRTKSPNIEKWAAHQTVNLEPKSISEFVEIYQFILAYMEELRANFTQEGLTKKQLKDESYRFAEKQIDPSNGDNITSIKKMYDEYFSKAEASLTIHGLVNLKDSASSFLNRQLIDLEDPVDVTNARIYAVAIGLNFQTPSALAYHVIKHSREGLYTKSDNIENNINNYISSMRDEVKKITVRNLIENLELTAFPSQFTNDIRKFALIVPNGKGTINVFLTVHRNGNIHVNSYMSK